MAVGKGSVVVLSAVLCVLSVVDAKPCVPPLVGEWTMMHYFPDPESEDGFVLGAQSNYTLINPQERVYQGSGMAGSVLPDAPPPGEISILTIFDPEECTLSGALYIFQINASDVYVWDVVGGTSMTGEYTAFENEILSFTRFGKHEATYIGGK